MHSKQNTEGCLSATTSGTTFTWLRPQQQGNRDRPTRGHERKCVISSGPFWALVSGEATDAVQRKEKRPRVHTASSELALVGSTEASMCAREPLEPGKVVLPSQSAHGIWMVWHA